MPQDIIIVGADGTRRRARPNETLREGERVLFSPLSMLDAMANAVTANFHDGVGHKPGYGLSCADGAQLRDAATQAYVERCERLQDAWRHRNHQQVDEGQPAPTRDQSSTHAEDAYRDKCARIANQWRTR